MRKSGASNDFKLMDRLTVEQVALIQGTTVAEVAKQTREGRLLAATFESAFGATLYPAFQFVGVLRDPVLRCLDLLGPVETYLYLSSVHPDMAGLTPLEVLLGQPANQRTLVDQASQILSMDADERVQFVLGWALIHRDQTS